MKMFFLNSLRRHLLLWIFFAVSSIITTLGTGVVTVELFRKMTDAILHTDFRNLVYNLIIFCIVTIGLAIFTMLQKTAFFRIRKGCVYELSDKLCSRYMNQKEWTSEEGVQVQTYIQKVIPETADGLLQNVLSCAMTTIAVISGVWYGLTIQPLAVWICMLLTIVMVFFSVRALAKNPEANRMFVEGTNKVRGQTQEQIRNLEIGSFLRQDRVMAEYEKENSRFLKNLLTIKKMSNGASLFSMFGSSILIIVIAFIGGWSIMQGTLYTADLLALVLIIPTVASNLFGIPSLFVQFRKESESLKAIQNVMNKEAYEYNGKQTLAGIQSISIQNLCYEYPQQTGKVLQNVTLHLERGIWCMTGASGCGKSTLIKLIGALLSLEDGDIKIDEIPLNQIDRREYWKQICYIDQKPVIFPGSLLYNITMTNNPPDEARLHRAIEDAGLTEWVKKRSGGLNAWIDTQSLSKGEIQKISFSRAFYKEAQAYLLDECTEGLDPGMEKVFIDSLRRRAEENDLLVLIISHRKAVLQSLKKIIFMENGEIRQISTHDELIRSNAAYRQLIQRGETE